MLDDGLDLCGKPAQLVAGKAMHCDVSAQRLNVEAVRALKIAQDCMICDAQASHRLLHLRRSATPRAVQTEQLTVGDCVNAAEFCWNFELFDLEALILAMGAAERAPR